ncbi:hypothetical protein B7486_59060, partial [cyanobacterium TDX16]
MDPDLLLAARAAHRHGLLTRAEAREAGLSPRQIERRVSTNRWKRWYRGVYSIVGAPATLEQELLAACLATAGAASHRACMSMWDIEPDRHCLDISVTRDRAPYFEGIVLHRSG